MSLSLLQAFIFYMCVGDKHSRRSMTSIVLGKESKRYLPLHLSIHDGLILFTNRKGVMKEGGFIYYLTVNDIIGVITQSNQHPTVKVQDMKV